MFFPPDEFAILMDVPYWHGRAFNDSELAEFRKSGIKTMWWCGPKWNDFSTKDFEYNWKLFDDYLERAARAGMKAIIPLWQQQSTLQPDHFYCRNRMGQVIHGVLSPWSKAAQDKSNRLLQMVIERYAGNDVLFVNGQNHGGERVLMNYPCYFDEAAVEDWLASGHTGIPDHTTPEGAEWLKQSYTRLLHDQMAIFINQPSREIWYSLSRYKAIARQNISCHGCEWIDDYLEDWQGLKPSRMTHVSFNYFPYGDSFAPVLAAERERWGVDEIVGAEYCEGLRDGNGRKAIKSSLRVIVGPTHPLTHHDRMEAWQYAEIKRNVSLYKTHPELRVN